MTILAQNLTWGLRARTIVKDVSLQVAEGETLGLIGPNGSGKSSLLRLLAGLRAPQGGSVRILGQDIARMPRRALAQQLAFVSQNATTESSVTVTDVVRLGRTPHRGALAGWSPADEAAVTRALAQVDMGHRRQQSWATLSGGERQRVHIARALAQTPRVMFLDEPTNHLDIHHQIEILRLVRDLNLTSVVALHDLNLAASFCDRILVLQDGAVVACGAPQEVLTEKLLADVFRVDAEITSGPKHPLVRFKVG